MERVALVRFHEHLTENGLWEFFQSAYRQGHSTETALLKVSNDILGAMDSQNVTLLIMLDLSAAFDTIDHGILLHRLSERLGIKDAALNWIKSYLSDRHQYVSVDGKSSKQTPLTTGVPQGSVLGPFLFVTYTTPIGDIVKQHGLKYHIYADDTQLYFSFSAGSKVTSDMAISKCVNCALEVRRWMLKNMLKVNMSKTEVIILGTWQQRAKLDLEHLHILDSDIAVSEKVKNLGVLLDSDMSMDKQISNVCRSANCHLRSVRAVSKYLPRDALKTAIHSSVTSRLDTANSLLAGICRCRKTQDSVTCYCKIQRLQVVQNNAARVIVNIWNSDHITPVIKNLHWLPIRERIQFKILTLVHKCLLGLAPPYLSELIKVYMPGKNLRSKDRGIVLKVPKTKLVTGGDRMYSTLGPILWNSLPAHLRRADISHESFRKSLKTHMFKQAYGG